MNTANTLALQLLGSFPGTLAQIAMVYPDGARHWMPADEHGSPGEPFTFTQHYCHLRDIEIDGYQQRYRAIIEHDRPFLRSLNGIAMARERHYERQSAEEALQAFAQARQETLSLLRGLEPAQLARTADYEGYGLVSLQQLMALHTAHDAQHLAALWWMLGRWGA